MLITDMIAAVRKSPNEGTGYDKLTISSVVAAEPDSK
jgi:hypothetical protein